MKDLDRYRGCLIGGAVGDALGYAVEFLPALFGGGDGANFQSQSLKAQGAVPVAHNGDLIHLPYPL